MGVFSKNIFWRKNPRSSGAAFNGQRGKSVKKQAFGTGLAVAKKNHRRAPGDI